MKELICDVKPFIMQQTICQYDTETGVMTPLGTCTIDELKDTLLAYAHQQDIFNFHLYGDKHILSELGKELDFACYQKYSYKTYTISYN